MHILTILPPRENFSPAKAGAVALCVQDFVRHSRYRHSITVLGADPQGGFDGLHYRSLRCIRYGVLSHGMAYTLAAIKHAWAHRPDMIEVQNRPRLAWALALSVPFCRIVLHLHNDPQEMMLARTATQRTRLIARIDAIYCVSHFIRGRFLEGVPSQFHDKIHVIHNGITVPEQPFTEQKENVIIFAGRLAQTKGALEFAQALRQVLPELGGWRGVMVGADRHAPSDSRNDYERSVYATLAPLDDKVEILGFLPHAKVMEQFARARIAVVPSQWDEPFGRTALEAIASGAALIATASGGLQEVFAEAGVGIYPATADALAVEILRCARDETLCANLSHAGYARAQHFAIAKLSKLLDDTREKIMHHSHA